MTIIIKMQDGGEDYGIIELQGDIKSHSGSDFDGKFLGHLFYGKDGVPTLIIGHHMLYGKEVTLEKPLAMLKKVSSDGKNAEYHVQTIIRRKILFKNRPKPIVNLPNDNKK